MLAAQLPDILFFLNFATWGLEYSYLDKSLVGLISPYHLEAEYSHSLLGGILLGCIMMAIFIISTPRNSDIYKSKYAFVLFLACVSHWFLDLIVHRPDLAIIPLRGIHVGFGLWDRSRLFNLVLEYAVFLPGLYLFLKNNRPTEKFNLRIFVFVTITAIAQFLFLFESTREISYIDASGILMFLLFVCLGSTLIDSKVVKLENKPRFD